MHGQLAAPELAEGEDGPARLRTRRRRARRAVVRHHPRRRLQRAVGDERQLLVQLVEAALGQPLDERLELLYRLDPPERIEARGEVSPRRDLVEPPDHLVAERVGVDDGPAERVQELRVGGEPRRVEVAGVEARHEPPAQLLVVEEGAEEGPGRAGARRHPLEADEHPVQPGRRVPRQHLGQQVRQQVPRRRPAVRRRRVEGPHGVEGAARLVDPGLGEPRPRVVVAHVSREQPEHLAAGEAAVLLLPFEQVGVDRVHAVPVAVQHLRQGLEVVEPEPSRQRPQPPFRAGEGVGLLALRDLQAVLDVPQEDVRGRQVPPHLRLDEPVRAEVVEGGQGVAGAQVRRLAAVDDLEHLREQLDLADAPAPLLHVLVEVAALAVLAVGPRLVAGELLDGRVVQVLAVHEGDGQLDEPPAEVEVARDRPRLDEREPLERLAHALVVLRRLLQRVDEVAALPHRAQAHVDPVEVALAGMRAEQAREPAPQLLVAPLGGAGRIVRGVVDVDEVDVGAVVEIAAAELAHADDREPPRQRAVGRRLLGRRDVQHLVDQGVGEVRELGGRRRQRLPVQHAEEIQGRDPQHLASLVPLEPVHLELDGAVAVEQPGELLVVGVAVRRRPVQLAPQPVQVAGVADEDLGEERGGPQNLRQDVQDVGIVAQGADERRLRGAGGDVAAETDDGRIGVGSGRDLVEQQGGETAQGHAARQVVGELLELLIGGGAVAHAAALEKPRGRLGAEVGAQEDVLRCDGVRFGRHGTSLRPAERHGSRPGLIGTTAPPGGGAAGGWDSAPFYDADS